MVKHALDALEALAADCPEDYAKFWKALGVFVKQGVASDYEHRERLAKLLRWESTECDESKALTSLEGYVLRMKEGQHAIYYAIGESRLAIESAPHLEGLKKRGFEVLFMTDPIDEWTAESLREFQGKPLVSAMRADLKIEASEGEKKAREVAGERAREGSWGGARQRARDPRERGALERPPHRFAELPGARERRSPRVRRAPACERRGREVPKSRASSS